MSIYQALGTQGVGNFRVEWEQTYPLLFPADEKADRILIPGFVDLHFHGAFGLDFMTASREELGIILRGLVQEGYEGVYLTTVSSSVEGVLAAIERLPEDDPTALGVHLEGPFLSKAFAGAQPIDAIVDPPIDASEWDAVFDHPRLKIVTLAPERPHALPLMAKLASKRLFVNMGHSAALYDEARRGFEFGASGVAHLFNGMATLHHRNPGLLAYALQQDGLYAELIYDREHVATEVARLLFKIKPIDRILAVSDGVAAIGQPPGTKIDLWGNPAVVEKTRVERSDGRLAGSIITLRDAFKNLAEDFGLEAAIRCCCLNPRKAMGLGEPRVWVEMDLNYRVIEIHRLS